ncbi:uncharacterized protein V1510DRAFT_423523 [Dipodascopsis tothii]|uniref:uncharacterized protein n=1 Tax=Dipodascopsis tothii TaxID=44089 RepID=UPI0034CF4841
MLIPSYCRSQLLHPRVNGLRAIKKQALRSFRSSTTIYNGVTNESTRKNTGIAIDPVVSAVAAEQRLPTILRLLPPKARPYAALMRIEKPVGTWLLFWPSAWGITMAAIESSASPLHTAGILGLFGVGSLIMRGAGCTINDLWDRDLDDKVARTTQRPLAAKVITPKQAIIFLGGQMSVGLAVLLALPSECFLLGASSLALVATYPLFKRITYYPQVVLSLTFNWGALLGFPAMGVWDLPTMSALYASGVCWTMVYDTIYAHQDKVDDVNVGIKSTALAWGDNSKKVMSVLTGAQVGLLTLAGYLGGMGMAFYGGVAVAAYRLASMVHKVDLDNPEDCWNSFKHNIHTGAVIFSGVATDYVLRLLGI